MGMSASQARLLSITSRLTNNEFRAQTITNSKLRLAEKSAEASSEYMDALSSQQLVYGVYSDNGEYTTQKLTPALIYDYAPLKNQYALVNPAGKMLVSSVDAKNFENNDNLYDFLECYGLVGNVELLNEYNADMNQYNIDKAKYDEDKAKYDYDIKIYQDQLAAYEEFKNQEDLYAMFSGVVGTSDTVQNTGAQGHYYRALKENNAECYLHVLNVLFDYNGTNLSTATRETSLNGISVTFAGKDGGMASQMTDDEKTQMAKISGLLSERYCDGDDDFNTAENQNLLQTARDNGREPTSLEILRSDFKEIDNGDGTYSYENKTLEQKLIDLYYIIQNRKTLAVTNDAMTEMLMNFTDGDMKKLQVDPPGEKPEKPIAPTEPEKPQFDVGLNDKDKAQWYVNLWHYMNGSETANKVNTTILKYNNREETVHTVENSEKSGKGGTYEVFEDLNLFKSSDWLQFALEHGMVTMVQAQYDNPANDSGKVPELTSEGITWKSIIYTNAADIRSQDDEVKIALAEVKYKNAVREIENKDKKFDQDLKKLDTEHTALQTEYDSIKEVISKNTERSFKAFS